MEIIVDFPGGSRVDAHIRTHTLSTDLPPAAGGEDSAPNPFETFLGSLGTCAGIFILGFCRQRNLPVEGIRLRQEAHLNPTTGMAEKIDLEIQVPPSFPEEYHQALIRAAAQCKVKKHLENPPEINTVTRVV